MLQTGTYLMTANNFFVGTKESAPEEYKVKEFMISDMLGKVHTLDGNTKETTFLSYNREDQDYTDKSCYFKEYLPDKTYFYKKNKEDEYKRVFYVAVDIHMKDGRPKVSLVGY